MTRDKPVRPARLVASSYREGPLPRSFAEPRIIVSITLHYTYIHIYTYIYIYIHIYIYTCIIIIIDSILRTHSPHLGRQNLPQWPGPQISISQRSAVAPKRVSENGQHENLTESWCSLLWNEGDPGTKSWRFWLPNFSLPILSYPFRGHWSMAISVLNSFVLQIPESWFRKRIATQNRV